MPKMTINVQDRMGGLTNEVARRALDFIQAETEARTQAARTAEVASRRVWNNRPNKRQPGGLGGFLGRETTGGKLASFIEWKSGRRSGASVVRVDVNKLDAAAPHWIIQEIGTGKRATIRRGGMGAKAAQPGTGSTTVRTVKKQRGRRIGRGGLVFASGGNYSPPGVRRDEQIYLASQVQGVPPRTAGIRIRREIKGQHFVKKGGQEGFRQYRRSTLAAARSAFRKRPRT